MVTFIHTADLHLDSPFAGLSRLDENRADLLKKAGNQSLRNIVDLCINENVDFLVIAGDVFDAANQSLNAQFSLIQNLKTLQQHNKPVFIAAGNHDPLNTWSKHIKLPDNTYLFGSEKVEQRHYHNPSGQPIVEILGISHQKIRQTNNLARLFPKGNPNMPTIAILHGNLSGQTEHDPYAPFQSDDLKKNGIDYWALGHIHKRQIISKKYPTAVYPGNPQGRNFKETGSKGCYKVSIETGNPPEITFIPTASAIFEYIDISIDNLSDWGTLIDLISTSLIEKAGGNALFARISLTGRTVLHTELSRPEKLEELKSTIEDNLPPESNLFPEKILLHTQPLENLEELENAGDFTGEVLKIFRKLQEDPDNPTLPNHSNPEESPDNLNLNKLIEQIRNEIKTSLPEKRFPPELNNEELYDIAEKAKWMFYDHFYRQ